MMIRQKAMRAALCEFSLKSQTVFFFNYCSQYLRIENHSLTFFIFHFIKLIKKSAGILPIVMDS